MDEPSFAYTSYIGTTPERMWQALIDPAFTQRYWGLELESDWQPGSTYTLHRWGLSIASPEQLVLESEPYRRLSLHVADVHPSGGTRLPPWSASTSSSSANRDRATFKGDLRHPGPRRAREAHVGARRLRGQPRRVLPTISQGWPHILSNLKTLLETGDTLPTPGG